MTTGTTAPAADVAPLRPAAPHERFFLTGRAQVVDVHDAVLWEALHRLTEGGKRFRPALPLALHESLGGPDPQAAAAVADAVELLHTAFVVHDDVIDGDLVRRGRPNVTGTFTARALTAGSAVETMAGELAASAIVTSRGLPDAAGEVLRAMVHRLGPARPTPADVPAFLADAGPGATPPVRVRGAA